MVQIEATSSSKLDCDNHGVPQGSILGGLLHIINSNDFPACHESGESIVFVDDDSDIVTDKNPETLRRLIEIEANKSANWLKDNRMCVAADKSKVLVIGTNKLKNKIGFDNFSITIDQQEIKASNHEKLLGVMIDDDLTWKSHLHEDDENEGLVAQLSKRLGIMKRLKKYMAKEKLKQAGAELGLSWAKAGFSAG